MIGDRLILVAQPLQRSNLCASHRQEAVAYQFELGAPSVDDGVSKDTVDRQYDQLTLRP